MIILGLECSSRQGSVALLKDGNLLAEKTWIADRVRHNVMFGILEDLFRDTELSYDDVSLYAVGRGPGSFSGMRMSFAVAQALALPKQTEVQAVSSGAALALAAVRETGESQIAVIGDARRGQVWLGFFRRIANEGVEQMDDWALGPYTEISIPEKTLIVSSEAERLEQWIPVLKDSRFPAARDIAELALKQNETEPLEPIYMHPPVFVEPKYI